ncbi:MAG: V4R domain-containing protein [Candidatus Helarchaeota archaeon]
MGLLEETKNFTFKDFSIFKGEIKGFNFRIIILHIEHFKQIYKTSKNILKNGIRPIYIKIGEDIGKKFMDLVITKKKADKITAFKFILRSLERSGWGATLGNIDVNEDKKTMYIEIQNSPEAYEPELASCFCIQGVLKGMAEILFDTELDIIETDCIAKGDKICKFLVGPKEETPPYEDEIMSSLKKIMDKTKVKAGAIAILISTTEGRVLFSTFPNDIDIKIGSIISSTIALSSNSAGDVFNIGKTFSTIDGELGKLIIMPVWIPNKKSGFVLVAQIGANSSTQLAGLALKSAETEIINLF